MKNYQLILGDCLEELPKIESNSIDAIFADPPYPYIKREYGYWTEAEWIPMMQEVVRQSRRILKPHGSAVFILQPNSEKVGKMRLWLWKFMVWAGEEWGIVQDAYWWNYTTLPAGGTGKAGLMRASVKSCIWLGGENCYRNQDKILWSKGEWHSMGKIENRLDRVHNPSGHSFIPQNFYKSLDRRGGVTPFNILPISNNTGNDNKNGHGAGTPLKLSDWWLRYIAMPSGIVLDCFSGTGTTGVAARRLGLDYIGIEKIEKYHQIAEHRLVTALDDRSKPTKKPIEDLPMFAEVAV